MPPTRTASVKTILLDGTTLTFEALYRVAIDGARVGLAPTAKKEMSRSRAVVERAADADQTAYGVNTGFGELAEVKISHDQIRQLQLNLVRSHSCGVGAPLSEIETRAMMALRANALAKGFSGVRPIVVETLCEMLNHRVHPIIPAQGSVGASGDLAPLAHLALVAIGEGEAMYEGARVSGADAMQHAGIAPLALEAKEGLSLLNGTQGMLALLSLALREAQILAATADVAAALSLDALRGSPAAFDARIAKARPHPGAIAVSANLTKLNRGSEIRESHRAAEKDPRVQDAYSLRCTPQVHGATRDSLSQIAAVLTIELNSATDNPLVFASSRGAGEIISGGNFHGQPLAMAADQMAMALANLAGISERRVAQLTNPQTSLLPAFLTKEPGLNSGFMILQVVAAGLASEMKAQSAPHSVDSVPTSADQEDYVSMGMSAARRLRPMLDNLRRALAIELLAACQGVDLLAPLKTGALCQKAYAVVRSVSPRLDSDRSMAADIEAVAGRIAEGALAEILG